jgi:hypothetical protein
MRSGVGALTLSSRESAPATIALVGRLEAYFRAKE